MNTSTTTGDAATSSIADALKELLAKHQGPNYDEIVTQHKDLISQLVKAQVAVQTIANTIKRANKELNARQLGAAIKKQFPSAKK